MDIDSPRAHGYGLDAELHRRLRGPVPDEALRWVELETGDMVVDQRALEGGNASAVHRLTLLSTGGAERRVVLRRYVLDWVLDEPWAPANEALVLGLLNSARSSLPVPELLAATDGQDLGAPAVLMSALPGEVVWRPADRESWLRCLAEALPTIHATPVSPQLSGWAPYPPSESGMPPRWTRHRSAWETAIGLFHGDRPAGERVFLHRDYHPGNVLWSDGAITGVVDWVSSCAGPPEEDVAHCRANLAIQLGQECADRFLQIWQDLTGRREYDPYYDLTGVVSFDNDVPEPRLDEFVAAAAAQLG